MKKNCGTSEGTLFSGIGDGDEGSKEEVIGTKKLVPSCMMTKLCTLLNKWALSSS